jgi:phage terminase large subunit-like protein
MTAIADPLAAIEAEAQALAAWWQMHKIETYFRADGPFRRELYSKQLEHFAAGKEHRERAFLAGNRCGKSEAGAYETTLHLTGEYPDWWPGRRFDCPADAWACGTTNAKTAEIVQAKLMGVIAPDPAKPRQPIGIGTGMIPADRIVHYQGREGLKNVIRIVWVKHKSGGNSVLEFKSYEMGRRAFEGTAQRVIWFDEEVPIDIYTEGLTRTMTTDGLVILTFTPLQGLSQTVLQFLPNGVPT